ncbi:MAG: hypothetical protein ACAI35_02080 [Candidatus Methylacidiphilales bacterium]|nr:hypothetical protein [Candidatus Methylacidiphilales bacterium]
MKYLLIALFLLTAGTAPEALTSSKRFAKCSGKRVVIEGVVTREKAGDTILFDGVRIIPLDPAGSEISMPSTYPGKKVRVTGIAEVWENTLSESEWQRQVGAGKIKASGPYARHRLMLKSAKVQLIP